MNPNASPIDENTPQDATDRVRKRRLSFVWITLIFPPLAMLASIGLGVFINSLTLGPSGFFWVIILIGPGAWFFAWISAMGVIAFLSQGSIAIKILLWIVEFALWLFTYSLVFPVLGGWS